MWAQFKIVMALSEPILAMRYALELQICDVIPFINFSIIESMAVLTTIHIQFNWLILKHALILNIEYACDVSSNSNLSLYVFIIHISKQMTH